MVCIQTSRDPTWFVNKTGFARGKGKGKGSCFFLSFLFEEKRGTALLIAFLRFAFLLSRPPSPLTDPAFLRRSRSAEFAERPNKAGYLGDAADVLRFGQLTRLVGDFRHTRRGDATVLGAAVLCAVCCG